jgi:hypothetical protein
MLEHIERLRTWRALDLPAGIERQIHQNRLLKIAREGGQMTSADLMKFEPERRYATLVALAVDGMLRSISSANAGPGLSSPIQASTAVTTSYAP